MNKIEIEKSFAETVRLYEVEQLSMKQIAKRLNMTRQAILYRLVQAGIKFRPKRHEVRKTIDHANLNRLYVEEGLAVSAVAKRLNLDPQIVVRELERFSIERRPRYVEKRKPTPLDNLKVGDSALMRYAEKKQYTPIHKLALVRKIKVSIKRVDPDHVRVTRTE